MKKTAKKGNFQLFLMTSEIFLEKIKLFLMKFIEHIITDIPANFEKNLAFRSDFISGFVNPIMLKNYLVGKSSGLENTHMQENSKWLTSFF